ncbi:uncharacterized protein LOC129975358 [Argiope bruennichi]|uniref:uncharacterized protein LOC129975358 n=1 Tax=Argiope bruennichi TaxID=94029 RepID=UPI0024947089|nr:uncharacterized protein LOC129975358 [Argiope bruennichi]
MKYTNKNYCNHQKIRIPDLTNLCVTKPSRVRLSDSEDDMSDDQASRPSVSLELESRDTTVDQPSTEDRLSDDGTAGPSSEGKVDSDMNKEVKPLLKRDSSPEWVAEEIFLKTKPSVVQFTKGAYAQTVIEEEMSVARESRFPAQKQKYFVEDFIWQSVSGHPYILPLYTTFFNSKKFRYNFISHYLPMVNLRKFIKIHKVLQTKVCRVLTSQIVSAICFIHNKGLY